MTELESIIQRIKEHKAKISKEYNISKIGIFGSYIRGEERPESDVDILVEFEKPVDMFRFLELEEILSELFGKKVDLVSGKFLKHNIGRQILNEVRYV